MIAEWITSNRQLRHCQGSSQHNDLTVNELFLAYWNYAQSHYRKNGRPTSQQGLIKPAVRPLVDLYGPTSASEFGPLSLKVIRDKMISADISLGVVNKYVGIIKRLFKWASENELVPASVYHGLQTVKGLQHGRSSARETDTVVPVPEPHIDLVLHHVSRQVQAMIRLQSLTGMRPGEATSMRGCDLDTSGKIWIYEPGSHKTEHHRRERVIYIGPKAQGVLLPFLNSDLTSYLFSPADAMKERNAFRKVNRKSPMKTRQAKCERKKNPKRTPGNRYTKDSYRTAIQRACDMAGIPHWSPNQLRHNAATSLRKEFGIEAARVVLGHSSAAVTEIYAEVDKLKAADIMSKIG